MTVLCKEEVVRFVQVLSSFCLAWILNSLGWAMAQPSKHLDHSLEPGTREGREIRGEPDTDLTTIWDCGGRGEHACVIRKSP